MEEIEIKKIVEINENNLKNKSRFERPFLYILKFAI